MRVSPPRPRNAISWKKYADHIARPAISEERLSLNARGEVIYKFKKPWDDGTAALKMTQMELMEKLAALTPRPRVHLTRFHGVLGPHYKYRKQIVPKKKKTQTWWHGLKNTYPPV